MSDTPAAKVTDPAFGLPTESGELNKVAPPAPDVLAPTLPAPSTIDLKDVQEKQGGLEKIVNLSDREKTTGAVTPMDVALVKSIYADIVARVFMVLVIAIIFIGLNWGIFSLVKDAFTEDVILLKAKVITSAGDRAVTTTVFVSLITATVVQVGAAIVVIVNYLFPKKP